jgi:uncharacterized protein
MEQRQSKTDLEIRGDGRTVVGIAMPYDSPTVIRGSRGEKFVEVFRQGAFARTIKERGARGVKFLAQHDHQAMPLGVADVLREDKHGLYAELRVSDTPRGDEALALIRDGALDGLSVGFEPIEDRWTPDSTAVERLEVKLREISAVSFPAFEAARITALRSGSPLMTTTQARQSLLAFYER